MAKLTDIGGGIVPTPLPNPIPLPPPPLTLFLVSGFTPASGAPGTQVTINGSAFLGSTEVRFGGRPARSFTVFSDSQIVAEVPTDAVDGPVTVVKPNGSASSGQSFDVLASSPLPSLSGFNPLHGQAGSQVTLSGQSLSPVNAVTLGNLSCPVISASPSSLVITIPAGASSARFTVSTPAGSAMSQGTFVVIQASSLPRVDGFSPSSGPVGTTVTINGANFTGTFEVDFGGVPSNLFSAGANQITAQVPPGAPSGPIRVSTNLGSATSATSFQVQAASNLPTLTSFSPLQGAPGTQVTLNGSNLSGATVRFNGVVATVLSNNGNQIVTVVPTGASSGPITATTAAGTAMITGNFVVLPPSPVSLPTITGLNPVSGTAGTPVTISGANLSPVSSVRFNGVEAGFTFAASSSIQTKVPQGATSGFVTVTTPAGTAQSSGVFTVNQSTPAPIVTGFSPASGKPGDTITIFGANFTSGSMVRFNGVNAALTAVDNPGQIRAVVPTGATSGPISVTTAGGTAQSPGSFIVVADAPSGTFGLALQNLGDFAPLAQGSNGPFVFNIRSGKEIKGRVTAENGPPGDTVKVTLTVQTTPAGLPPLETIGIVTSLSPKTFPADTGGATLSIRTAVTTPPFENLVFRVDAVSTRFANVTYKPLVIVVNDREPIALDPQPFEFKATQGGEALYNINIDRNKEATGLPVALSTDPNALPPGSTIKFEPQSTTGNSALLRIGVPASAPKTTFKFSVAGQSSFNGAKVFVKSGDARLKVTELQVTLETPQEPVKVRAVETSSVTIGVRRTAGGMPVTDVPVKVRITNREDLKRNGFDLLPETGELTVNGGDSVLFGFQIDAKNPPQNPDQEVSLEASVQDVVKASASFFLRAEGGARIEVETSPLDVPVGGSNQTNFTVERSPGFRDVFTLEGKVSLPDDLKGLVTVMINPPVISEGDTGGTVTVTLAPGFPAGEGFLIQIEAPDNENVVPGPLAITSVPGRAPAPPLGGGRPVPKPQRPPRIPRGKDPLE